MKKIITLISVAALSVAMPASLSAQGFLKKLGNAVMNSGQSQSQQNTSQQPAEDNLYAMPGVEFKYIEAYHEGLGAVVDFALTNSSRNSYDITFNGTNGLPNWSKSQAVGGDGAARECFVRIDGVATADMVTRYTLTPGATVRCSFKINKLDRTITTLNGISVAGVWNANNDNNNHNFRFNVNGPLQVITPQNTTQENVICTMPYLTVHYDKVERVNGNVLFHFTIKNIGQKVQRYEPTSGYVKDINGKDDYVFGVAVNGKNLGRYDYVEIQPGETVNGIFGVIDVPTTVKVFDVILWMLERPEYLIQLRNQAIPTK